MVVRAIGLTILGLCALAVSWLYRAVQAPQPHASTLVAAIAAAFAFLCWTIGGAFTVEGPALFKRVPIPGRHTFDPGDNK